MRYDWSIYAFDKPKIIHSFWWSSCCSVFRSLVWCPFLLNLYFCLRVRDFQAASKTHRLPSTITTLRSGCCLFDTFSIVFSFLCCVLYTFIFVAMSNTCTLQRPICIFCRCNFSLFWFDMLSHFQLICIICSYFVLCNTTVPC